MSSHNRNTGTPIFQVTLMTYLAFNCRCSAEKKKKKANEQSTTIERKRERKITCDAWSDKVVVDGQGFQRVKEIDEEEAAFDTWIVQTLHWH
jgi:hypothetical protein